MRRADTEVEAGRRRRATPIGARSDRPPRDARSPPTPIEGDASCSPPNAVGKLIPTRMAAVAL